MSLNKGTTNWKKYFSASGPYAEWRIISILVIGMVVVSAFFVGQFIYQNIYTTLANANDIAILESGLRVDVIDMKAYNQAEEKIAVKKERYNWPEKLRIVFDYVSPTSTIINTATSTKIK